MSIIYVNNLSGSDNYTGFSTTQAMKTIRAGVDKFTYAITTMYVITTTQEYGGYDNEIISHTLTGNNITTHPGAFISGYPIDSLSMPVIRGVSGTGSPAIITLTNASYIKLSHLEFTGNKTAVDIEDSREILIEKCKFTKIDDSSILKFASVTGDTVGIDLQYNHLDGLALTSNAIEITGSVGNISLQNNIFSNMKNSMWVRTNITGTNSVNINHNTFAGVLAAALFGTVTTAATVTIANNIVSDHNNQIPSHSFYGSADNTLTAIFNSVSASVTTPYENIADGTGNITAEPSFVGVTITGMPWFKWHEGNMALSIDYRPSTAEIRRGDSQGRSLGALKVTRGNVYVAQDIGLSTNYGHSLTQPLDCLYRALPRAIPGDNVFVMANSPLSGLLNHVDLYNFVGTSFDTDPGVTLSGYSLTGTVKAIFNSAISATKALLTVTGASRFTIVKDLHFAGSITTDGVFTNEFTTEFDSARYMPAVQIDADCSKVTRCLFNNWQQGVGPCIRIGGGISTTNIGTVVKANYCTFTGTPMIAITTVASIFVNSVTGMVYDELDISHNIMRNVDVGIDMSDIYTKTGRSLDVANNTFLSCGFAYLLGGAESKSLPHFRANIVDQCHTGFHAINTMTEDRVWSNSFASCTNNIINATGAVNIMSTTFCHRTTISGCPYITVTTAQPTPAHLFASSITHYWMGGRMNIPAHYKPLRRELRHFGPKGHKYVGAVPAAPHRFIWVNKDTGTDFGCGLSTDPQLTVQGAMNMAITNSVIAIVTSPTSYTSEYDKIRINDFNSGDSWEGRGVSILGCPLSTTQHKPVFNHSIGSSVSISDANYIEIKNLKFDTGNVDNPPVRVMNSHGLRIDDCHFVDNLSLTSVSLSGVLSQVKIINNYADCYSASTSDRTHNIWLAIDNSATLTNYLSIHDNLFIGDITTTQRFKQICNIPITVDAKVIITKNTLFMAGKGITLGGLSASGTLKIQDNMFDRLGLGFEIAITKDYNSVTHNYNNYYECMVNSRHVFAGTNNININPDYINMTGVTYDRARFGGTGSIRLNLQPTNTTVKMASSIGWYPGSEGPAPYTLPAPDAIGFKGVSGLAYGTPEYQVDLVSKGFAIDWLDPIYFDVAVEQFNINTSSNEGRIVEPIKFRYNLEQNKVKATLRQRNYSTVPEYMKTFMWTNAMKVTRGSGTLNQIPLAGCTDARYVFRLSFDRDLVAAPMIELWDDITDIINQVNPKKPQSIGTDFEREPCIYAQDTTDPSVNYISQWVTGAIQGGSATNGLNGSNSFMQFALTPVASQAIYFNIACVIPEDINIDGDSAVRESILAFRALFSNRSIPGVTLKVNTGSNDVSYENSASDWRTIYLNHQGAGHNNSVLFFANDTNLTEWSDSSIPNTYLFPLIPGQPVTQYWLMERVGEFNFDWRPLGS